VARATELGATVLLDTSPSPVGQMAVLADPAGAPFGISHIARG